MIDSQYVEETWRDTKRVWTHVNLRNPRIFAKEEEEGLGDDIACFDFAEKQVYVDEANLEKKLGLEDFPSVLSHEVGHHKKCPYDLRNFFRLIANARKEVDNIKDAKLMENLFADLLVNNHIYKKGDNGIKRVYQKFSKGKNSKLWQFYISTFEHMIGEVDSILPNPAEEEVRKDGARIGDILSKVKNSGWGGAVREFSRTAKKYMDEDKKDQDKNEDSNGSGDGSGQGNDGGGNGYDDLPIDNHDVKDFVPFDPDTADPENIKKYVETETGEFKGIAKEVGHETFKEVVEELGLGTKRQANIWFYKDLMSDFLMDMPKYFGNLNGSKPKRPKKWRPSDPLEKLNVEYSLSMHGVMIAGVTTYQFISSLYGDEKEGDEAPDLLIVLDSSASMPDPNAYDGQLNINPEAYFSFPVLSAMIAANTALENGKKVAVINFDHGFEYLDYTNNSNDVFDAIINYRGGATDIPGETIKDSVAGNNYPTHVLIISDTMIGNLTDEIGNLEYALRRGEAGGTIFMDSYPSENSKKLSDIGFDVQFTKDFDDIANLTLNKAKGVYGRGG
ncbi:VWA domain-containing protein [Candidatus Woesearchaeota archaeon]|nr:VWA domain-containing protein [Candidatus Woesearchaeota archaeon]